MKLTMRIRTVVLLALFTFILAGLPAAPGAATNDAAGAYLDQVIFEKFPGKERVTLAVSRPVVFRIEDQTARAVVINLAGTLVPEEFRRPQGVGKLDNVLQVTAVQKGDVDRQWTTVTIDLKERTLFSVKAEGQKILIDFNVASLAARTSASEERATALDAVMQKTPGTIPPEGNGNRLAGKRISLDFQDANIKAVFRLLAEVSGMSIVSGEDIKGNVTVHMENVLWEQALDTILQVNSLTKKVQGNIITILTVEKMKKEEEDLRKANDDRRKSELAAKEEETKQRAEQGKLRQISIEAKIIEATDSFTRKLGIQWGGAQYQKIGDYSYAVAGGTNTASSSRSMKWAYPDAIPFQDLTDPKNPLPMFLSGVSYPAVLSSPTLGVVIGGSAAVLEAQISALEATSDGKIISSPKIVTMDNVKAIIRQGQDVPYVTPASGTSPAVVTFKEATLKLEVTPRITSEGKISMNLKASNDYADYGRAQQLQGNPPINRSEIDSNVVISNGDTIVIGGVLRTEDVKGVSGLPWLQKIPVLGWLFKTEDITKNKRQLLIFVTPRIIPPDAKSS